MPSKPPDKLAVHRAVLAYLREASDKMTAVARDTAAGATHEESRSEGDKDMRATEQSYVARGQAMRAEELLETLGRLQQFTPTDFGPERPIGAGALVEVDVDGERKWLYVVAAIGGTEVRVGGTTVLVITPSSPVGKELVGKLEGDAFELRQAGKLREWVVERVV